MPLYDFECPQCDLHFERVLSVDDCDSCQPCPECDSCSKKIISLGHGGIFRKGDAVSWVKDAAKVLTKSDRPNPNLQTVDDYRRYLTLHPEVRPKESHPCIPSSYGDCFDAKPDPKQIERERSKRGEQKLREMRTITLSGQARP